MKKLTHLLLASTLVVLVSSTAQAVILYTNPWDPNGATQYSSFSTFDGGTQNQAFTDYTWDGVSTFTDFHWWGSPSGSHSDIYGFIFEIWSNDAGTNMPGVRVYNETFVGDAGATLADGSTFVYEYGIDLSTPYTPSAPGTYWFSVMANSNQSWSWAPSSDLAFMPDLQHRFASDNWVNPVPDLAFTLTGTAPGTAPVPEPGTLSLLGVGLAGVAMRARGRKKS